MAKVWRDVERTVINFSLDRETCRPGEQIKLIFKSREKREIKLKLRLSGDIQVEDSRVSLKGGNVSVVLIPMLPGTFKVVLELVDRTPNRYVIKRGRKILVYDGSELEIAELKVKW